MKTLEIRESPITLDLAKQHLRVGSATHDDTLITAKLDMAVAVAEDRTGRIIREKKVSFDVLIPTDAPIVRLPSYDADRAARRISFFDPRKGLHASGGRL